MRFSGLPRIRESSNHHRIFVDKNERYDYTNCHSKQCAVFCTTQSIKNAGDSISKASEHDQEWDRAGQQRPGQSFELSAPPQPIEKEISHRRVWWQGCSGLFAEGPLALSIG
jgi:hypothetical protein